MNSDFCQTTGTRMVFLWKCLSNSGTMVSNKGLALTRWRSEGRQPPSQSTSVHVWKTRRDSPTVRETPSRSDVLPPMLENIKSWPEVPWGRPCRLGSSWWTVSSFPFHLNQICWFGCSIFGGIVGLELPDSRNSFRQSKSVFRSFQKGWVRQ